jgi:hypothetical protein
MRKPHTAEIILWGCGSEIIFWFLLVLSLALSAWSWIAAAIPTLVLVGFYLVWVRTESSYHCDKCNEAFPYLYARSAWERRNA